MQTAPNFRNLGQKLLANAAIVTQLATTMSLRRLEKELQDLQTLQNNPTSTTRNITLPQESNLLQWEALLLPPNPPYNTGAFRIEIQFPPEYPFKPPKIHFKTKIYHPNVDDNGHICFTMLNPDIWKPATKMEHVLKALVNLIDNPEPEHPLRIEIAQEFVGNKDDFMRKAEEWTGKFGEKRPN